MRSTARNPHVSGHFPGDLHQRALGERGLGEIGRKLGCELGFQSWGFSSWLIDNAVCSVYIRAYW